MGSRSNTYIGPSWSWASIAGPVRRPSYRSNTHVLLVAQILHLICEHACSGSYGQVTGGILRMRAPSVTIAMSLNELWSNGVDVSWYELQSNGERVSQSCHHDIPGGCTSVAPPFPAEDVLCVLIACHQRTETEEDARALVLVADQTVPNLFERVGVAQLNLEVGGIRSRMETRNGGHSLTWSLRNVACTERSLFQIFFQSP
jgi:hypothetical protein